MAFVLKANGAVLPSPVRIRADDELIWSENTGRDSSGDMVGTIIAQKKAIEVEWGILTAAQMKQITDNVSGKGFFSLEMTEVGTITCYRSTVSKEMLGYIGDGTFYYRSASVSFIQK